jgi:hypothetical protein
MVATASNWEEIQSMKESRMGQFEKVRYLMSDELRVSSAQTKNPKPFKRRTP